MTIFKYNNIVISFKELKNLIQDPASLGMVKKLKKELLALRKQYQDNEPAGALK